ncbi:MAG: universal stress protein [Microscillaceae bacterium]
MKKILVPYDFSEIARQALAYAGFLAKLIKAELVVAHVLEQGHRQFVRTNARHDAQLEQEYLDYVREAVSTHIQKNLSALELEARLATPLETDGIVPTLLGQMAQEAPEMVVMGTHGHNGLENLLTGSRTEQLLRKATCPVLSLRAGVPLPQLKKILVATSLEREDLPMLSWVRKFQQLTRTHLEVVAVNTPARFQSDDYWQHNAQGLTEAAQLTQYTLHLTAARTEEEGILHQAEQTKPDLIVMGTHQREGALRFFLGSIAESLIQKSSWPILTFGNKYVKN